MNPSSVMGATNRVAERYVQAVAEHPGVRGSVICAVLTDHSLPTFLS